MPDRNGPTDPWERSIKDICQGKISPPKIQKCLGTAMYSGRHMQPSPAQPRS